MSLRLRMPKDVGPDLRRLNGPGGVWLGPYFHSDSNNDTLRYWRPTWPQQPGRMKPPTPGGGTRRTQDDFIAPRIY